MIKDSKKPPVYTGEETENPPGETKRYVVNAPVAGIEVPENRLRDVHDFSGLASMQRIGLLAPITITESGVLVSGRHRLEAAKSLGWRTIPAFAVPIPVVLEALGRAMRIRWSA